MKFRFRNLCIAVLLASACAILSFCRHAEKPETSRAYLNFADSVGYVGMQTCRSCHENIYQSFIHTGMGQSFGLATRQKSAADFQGTAVYDSASNFHYLPFWKNDSLYVKEFRIEGNDTTFSRTELISYIVGSGQHTNSHICNFNGYLFQAPITFYTQQRKWDMAPGFEGGFNSRFSRTIGLECMSCHNGLPQPDKSSFNKFISVPTGIDCERCHGAGGAHVQQKQQGIAVDTSKNIDYSIVNPKKLSRDLQMSLCQRCHLQGLAVLKAGKDFDSFKPGMNLSEAWDVFLPETDESKSKFIMASQAERLVKSKCYVSSEMSCITCHNPHISVKQTAVEAFNKKCQSCHQEKSCTAAMAERKAQNDNCSGCHMPKSGTIDIPHVFITDHYIRKPEKARQPDSTEISKVKEYLKLKCYTNSHPSSETMAEAYLAFYEKFSAREYLLDSAAKYLSDTETPEINAVAIHYLFLKKDYARLIARANDFSKDSITQPWTHYRIGEAHYALGNYLPASEYFAAACKAQPLNMEFQNKLAASCTQLGKYAEAKKIYQFIVQEQPRNEAACSNLGFLFLSENDFAKAEQYFNKALSLNPDYEFALMNKARLYFAQRKKTKAEQAIRAVLKINPQNLQAHQMLEQLQDL